MSATARTPGTAERQGALWGARAADWAAQEEQQVPTYEEGIRRAGIGEGMRVLDVGCGSGVFLRTAAEHGAEVTGLDASEALVRIARERVPGADVRVGEMLALPFADGAFDAVTGFNSFQFAGDIAAALREAGRVARPGAPVVIQVWGRPERCDLMAMVRALLPLRPGRAPTTPPLSAPGVLEELAVAAGLVPEVAFDLVCAIEYPDDATIVAQMLSAGAAREAVDAAGEQDAGAAVLEAMAPFRTDAGGYRLENEWHFLLARA